MKHLKLFNDVASYEAWKNSEDYVLPNVSYTEDGNLYYSPVVKLTYNMVDLGLPSGTLWADRNVGATSLEDYGLYFQWGDTVGYTKEQVGVDKVFDPASYWDTTDGGSTFNKYAIDKLTTLEPLDDAASVNMGSDWRMPTQAEMQELIDNTTPTFIDLQGNEFSRSEAINNAIGAYKFKGIRLTGSNGNSIFIPASGHCYMSEFRTINTCLWSSDLSPYMSDSAGDLLFDRGGYLNDGYESRVKGYSVRAVCNK